jgi:ribonuclease-3
LLQERKLAAPRYEVVKERGPEHRKIFTVRAMIEGREVAEAEGASKKVAEQAAAQIALAALTQPQD